MEELDKIPGIVSLPKSNDGFQYLIAQKRIIESRIFDTNFSLPHGGVIVDLPDGKKGIAVAVIQPYYYAEQSMQKQGQARKLKILNLDGSEYMDLTEPELGENPSSQTKITRDADSLFVTTYNTPDSYLAKYRMGTFETEWKNRLGSTAMQSITVNDTHVICFNMTDGTIDYFNKSSGKRERRVDIKEQWGGHSHHNIESSDLILLAGVPGLSWIMDLSNQLKTFDGEGNLVNKTNIPTNIGTLDAVSVDIKLQKVYLAFGNSIMVFTPQGYQGTIAVPCDRVLELNVDPDTSSLIVSSKEQGDNGGKLDIISLEAINALTLMPTIDVETRRIDGPSFDDNI